MRYFDDISHRKMVLSCDSRFCGLGFIAVSILFLLLLVLSCDLFFSVVLLQKLFSKSSCHFVTQTSRFVIAQ